MSIQVLISASSVSFKMQIKNPCPDCLHTYLSWEYFIFFKFSSQQHTSSYSVQCESQHSCSPLLAVRRKQRGTQCLAQGHLDIICWHQGSLVFPESWLNVTQYTNQPFMHTVYSAALLQTIYLWVLPSTTALVNLNTNLQSQSSSRLPDSSCNPDSWKEKKTRLLQTVPRGDCAKEQQQSIKHAVKSWTFAIRLLCSFSLHIFKVPLGKRRQFSKMEM